MNQRFQKYDNIIENMERIIDVYKWESCATILSYLTILGSMKAFELRELTNIGEKSIFRSLKKLVDIGWVEKEKDDEAKDRRQATNYFIKDNIVSDPVELGQKEFIEYLVKINKFHMIREWYSNTNKASFGFIQALTDLAQTRIKEKKSNVNIPFNNAMFLELILSIPEPKLVAEKIKLFLNKEIKPYISQAKKNPLKNPVGFYLSFIPIE